MSLINISNSLGAIIQSGTTTTTGSIFLTLLIFVLILIAIALMFGIALEFTAIIVLPVLLGTASYYGEFLIVLIVTFIYLALIFTSKFILK